MLITYLTGTAGVVLVATAWVTIQEVWRRLIPARPIDPGSQASRLGCHGCAVENPCPQGSRDSCGRAEEHR